MSRRLIAKKESEKLADYQKKLISIDKNKSSSDNDSLSDGFRSSSPVIPQNTIGSHEFSVQNETISYSQARPPKPIGDESFSRNLKEENCSFSNKKIYLSSANKGPAPQPIDHPAIRRLKPKKSSSFCIKKEGNKVKRSNSSPNVPKRVIKRKFEVSKCNFILFKI